MKRSWSLLIAGVMLAAGCGEPPQRTDAPSALLFVRTASGLEVIDAATGGVGLRAEDAVVAPDFSTLVTAERRGGETLVRRLALSGEEIGRLVTSGELSPRVVGRGGSLVALGAPRTVGSAPYLPEGKTETRIVVVDQADEPGEVREFELEGNFEPEAFSTDGTELFMIEFLPAADPTRYQVRRLKLKNGRVVPIGRLKNAAPDQMQGTGRTQVHAPGGDELYTLYTQQEEAGHPGEADAAHGHSPGEQAFVHLLNLEGKWAHCIDLPDEFGAGDATASALAISPDGRRLYVVDWSNGVVALVNPRRLGVIRTAPVAFGPPDEETFARATDDRLYVAGGHEVVVLELSSFRVLDRWDMSEEVRGLNMSADGSALYVSVAQEIREIDPASGAARRATTVAGAGAIEFVGAP